MLEVGKTYSNLTILELVDWPTRTYKVCCKCGRVFTRTINSVNQLNGYCKSCRPLTETRKNKADPESKTRLYHIWKRMKSQCDNPQDRAYPRYGGRGISYPEAWASFPVFKAWALENGYTDNKRLIRMTSLLDFSPFNCSWATFTSREKMDDDLFEELDPHTPFTVY